LALVFSIRANALIVFWKARWVRVTCFSLATVVCLMFAMPGRKADSTFSRDRYVVELKKYEGTKYVWGGESRLGIDCSGLIRRDLFNSNFKQGLRTFNPALLRESIVLWWLDSSARALRYEHRQKTRLLYNAPKRVEF